MQSGHTPSPKETKPQLSFQCLKTIADFLMKEKKQTHYFDEKQLVCCQLGAEFPLVVKLAAGSDALFFCG